ncbi:hypothetical protein [Actinomadura opuntiae]|uniref:hypothetical protein n=1 Tax=Actinomadura sp. OS1-43 TaxID=604315 RepID=UPI00255A8051|nr:hypothetical protein [Actinomadura sp. OS1-43]MDL4812792.1 hypothetical protein [Actinomadura sp. OS1-43]
MKIDIDNRCDDYTGYRAARVKSLFNVDSGNRFTHTADLDIADDQWRIGVIVGPSGSGKTSIGGRIWGPDTVLNPEGTWPDDRPIIEAIGPDAPFDDVTNALGAVGLGDVPAWLRPYRVLSNGEKFRADLARVIAERPARVVIDEFSSVVDRQIAKVGAAAFAKSWRRGTGQAVLLSCHYDVLDWISPDWVYDTATGQFARGSLQYRRPRIDVEIREGGWSLWPYFEPHHYLKVAPMVASRCYVAFIDGDPVAHVAVGTKSVQLKGKRIGVEARACRLVVLPEWQGAGLGMRFLNQVCELQFQGRGRLEGRRMTTLFHTSHPNLAAALRRDKKWRQISGVLHGNHKGRSARSINTSHAKTNTKVGLGKSAGFGGHFRAVQGFRYYGETSAA